MTIHEIIEALRTDPALARSACASWYGIRIAVWVPCPRYVSMDGTSTSGEMACMTVAGILLAYVGIGWYRIGFGDRKYAKKDDAIRICTEALREAGWVVHHAP